MSFKDAKNTIGKTAGKFAKKAAETGGAAAGVAAEGAKLAKQKAGEVSHDLKMNYYKPVMPEEYSSAGYDRPGIVVIVDEDERKGIEECEGAIGWLSIHNKTEVLHLYNEFVESSGLSFYPAPTIGAVYMEDRFDNNRLIDLSCYMDVAKSDRITELKQIAHKLGAKECILSTFETEKKVAISKGKLGGKIPGKKIKVDVDASSKASETKSRTVLFEQKFDGNVAPMQPELKWYANDNEILSLIEMRLDDTTNNLTEYHAGLDCSTTSTMSASMAAKLDGILGKLGASMNFKFEGEVLNEMRQKMDFYLVF